MKRSFRRFNQLQYEDDVRNANWSEVFLQKDPFQHFDQTLMTIVENHAPIKKVYCSKCQHPVVRSRIKRSYESKRSS